MINEFDICHECLHENCDNCWIHTGDKDEPDEEGE